MLQIQHLAAGLSELRSRGGVHTPDVLHASVGLRVLEEMRPRPDDTHFWEFDLSRSAAPQAQQGAPSRDSCSGGDARFREPDHQ